MRNNQRAFLGVTLPSNATLWSAAVANRPLRPGVAADGAMLLPLEKGRSGEDTPPFLVEVTYVQRGDAWADKGRTRLLLPSVDLPIARAGVTVYHSPRFSIVPEPGAFRVNTDSGPFTETLRADAAASAVEPPAPPGPLSPRPPTSGEVDLIEQYRKEVAGRAITGPLPVTVPFPEFGTSVFLTSELTAELQGPALEFSYKRESRW